MGLGGGVKTSGEDAPEPVGEASAPSGGDGSGSAGSSSSISNTRF